MKSEVGDQTNLTDIWQTPFPIIVECAMRLGEKFIILCPVVISDGISGLHCAQKKPR